MVAGEVEANKAGTRRLMQRLTNTDGAIFDELVAETAVHINPLLPSKGRDAFRAFIERFRAAMPDLTFVVGAVIADGDHTAVRWTAAGTHAGVLFGARPTGRRLVATGNMVLRWKDGRVIAIFGEWDALGFLQQLGVMPPVPPP